MEGPFHGSVGGAAAPRELQLALYTLRLGTLTPSPVCHFSVDLILSLTATANPHQTEASHCGFYVLKFY